ncbi:hypothetical protein RCC89_08360 [Cytophagaceae bacterium ABcell3]|nr:hypothetical protein RCC89_08360 [Cytophagaceae bacterium ABcell3]
MKQYPSKKPTEQQLAEQKADKAIKLTIKGISILVGATIFINLLLIADLHLPGHTSRHSITAVEPIFDQGSRFNKAGKHIYDKVTLSNGKTIKTAAGAVELHQEVSVSSSLLLGKVKSLSVSRNNRSRTIEPYQHAIHRIYPLVMIFLGMAFFKIKKDNHKLSGGTFIVFTNLGFYLLAEIFN